MSYTAPDASYRYTQPVATAGHTGGLQGALSSMGVTNPSPLQPTYQPNPPMIAPAQMTPAQLDPNTVAGLGPQASISQLLNYAQPLFANSQRSLNDQLAAMGMVGGPALDATNALQNSLMQGLGPMFAGVIQNSQGNQLQAAIQNANLSQQGGLANQSALNSGNAMNVQDLINQQGYNTQAYNAANNNLYNAIMQGWQIPFNAYQGVNMAGLNSASNLAGIGAGNAGNLASTIANAFPVQQSPDFGGLGAAIGSLFAPQNNTPPTPPANVDYSGFV